MVWLRFDDAGNTDSPIAKFLPATFLTTLRQLFLHYIKVTHSLSLQVNINMPGHS